MNLDEQTIRSIHWGDGALLLLDQRWLPGEETYITLHDSHGVAAAIRDMAVRGAPAIGISAAYGVVLSAQTHRHNADWRDAVAADIETLRQARPTAVNLGWALTRMKRRLATVTNDPVSELLQEAQAIHAEDIAANRHMAESGAKLLQPGSRVLTHCNTGALATGGYGTALGVVRRAWETGNLERVYVDETRPWLQGLRLTVWELYREGIPATLICDSAAASLMQQKLVDWVIVGADRIAANGDVANKIGTYSLAVLARQHQVKFMVVAPVSTIDMTVTRGANIPVEHRPAEELTHIGGDRVGMEHVDAWNPVFDVTPSSLIDYIVTETTVVENPDKTRMRAAFR